MHYCSLGWSLAHPRIETLETHTSRHDGQLLETADGLLLSMRYVESLWSRAVGAPCRAFRSTRWETVAWEELTQLIRILRRLLARRAVLVCRLDLPAGRCQVRQRPLDELFPPGSELNAYEALCTVHPLLAGMARDVRQLVTAELYPVAHQHRPAFAGYLREFAEHFAPGVALWETGVQWTPLAQTSAGYSVAWSSAQIVGLPPLADHDDVDGHGEHEAAALVEALDLHRGIPRPRAGTRSQPAPTTTATDHPPLTVAWRRQEQQLTGRIQSLSSERALIRQQCHTSEALWQSTASVDAATLRQTVSRALLALGWSLDDPAAGDRVEILVADTASVPDESRQHSLCLRLHTPDQPPREAAIVSLSRGPVAGMVQLESWLEECRARTLPADGLMIPLESLTQAAALVLSCPADLDLARRLRQELVASQAIYRFSAATALNPAEQLALQESMPASLFR